MDLYPLKFEPILEGNAESGKLLSNFLSVSSGEGGSCPNECWQIIDSESGSNQIQNGPYAGKSLRELVASEPERLIGPGQDADGYFPLCVRLKEVVAEDPIMVHPDHRRKARSPLTEYQENAKFWHVLDASESADLCVGINPRTPMQKLWTQRNTPNARNLLQNFKARKGDSYVIPPGVVHASGPSTLLWEVQKAPVKPLRLSNYSANDPVPEEEQEKAIESADFESRQTNRRPRATGSTSHTHRIPLAPNCPYFAIDEIRLYDSISLNTNKRSFQLLFVVNGSIRIEYPGDVTVVQAGEFCCIPAYLSQYKLKPETESSEILRATLPEKLTKSP